MEGKLDEGWAVGLLVEYEPGAEGARAALRLFGYLRVQLSLENDIRIVEAVLFY